MKTWKDFILKNFITGTVSEISNHINKMNIKLQFKPHRKDISSTVQYWLPLLAEGRIRVTSARYNKMKDKLDIRLGYNEQTKQYYLLNTKQQKIKLRAFSNTRGNQRSSNEDGISIFERRENLSTNHTKMLDVIENYAKHHNIKQYEIDKFEYVDYAEKYDDTLHIHEIKSYKNSIYTAVGQLYFYKWNILEKYKDIKHIKMYIVGNFDLQSKFKRFLKNKNIQYKHISEFKI